MLIKPLSLRLSHPVLPPAVLPLRRSLAIALLAASRALQRLAERVASAPARSHSQVQTPLLEFHAQAGAPEGALYVNGVLVGHLAGVLRL